MAFGFGFNKQKVLSSAEKFVQQGKLPNAISEYEKILKADPKDLTVMNTVGDLYSRLGETDKAADAFKNVGDAYASQGFTVKAIAMYKKLSKLKTSMECVLRLAELYTQQGLFNDARAQYLQVAEDFLKNGQLDQAVRIFEKTLEMDPDNVAMRTKLAEVYVRLGKKPEAWQILTSAAESLRAKGQLAAADEILQRMLKLEPGNSYALVLRGWAALEAGDAEAAIESLTKVADLDTNPEGLRILFQAYLRAKRLSDAGGLANKLANVHDDIAAIEEYASALAAAGEYREALQTYDQYSERLMRNDSGKLVEAVQAAIGPVRDDPQSLEIVLKLLQKAGENAHLTEVYELLAHANVQSGDLEKAREYYLKLTQLEPANQMHAQNYQQVLDKQGTAPKAARRITAEEGAAMVDELEATAPFIEQRYEDEAAIAVRAALTDAELFISYNMPAKAMAPLVGALPKAPRDLRMNQKLAALYTRTGKFAEAGVCCRTLETVYREAGHADEARRYAELAVSFEACGEVPRAAAVAPAVAEPAVAAVASVQPAVPEFEVAGPSHVPEVEEATPVAAVAAPPAPVAPKPVPSGLFFHAPAAATAKAQPSAAIPEAVVPEAAATVEAPTQSEADLSTEWEQDLQVQAPAVAETSVPNAAAESLPVPEEQTPAEAPLEISAAGSTEEEMEEVRFYLSQGMNEQAEEVLVKLEARAPEAPELAMLRLAVESAKRATVSAEPEPEVSEGPFAIDEEPAAAIPTPPPTSVKAPVQDPTPVADPAPAVAAAPTPTPAATPQPWPQQRPVLQEMVAEIEQSLGDGFVAEPKKAKRPEPEPETIHAQGSEFRSGTLDDFVTDLEASLGSDFAAETAASAASTATPSGRSEAPVAMAAAAGAAAAPVSRPADKGERQRPSAPAAPKTSSPKSPAPTSSAPKSSAPAAGPAHLPKFDSGAEVDLSDMFGELKQELESGGTGADEDPETHYNLGVAFREMGLLDEAIGELQKVIQSVEHGHAFPQMIQTYTWLAQCFLDKGVPEVAVRWYEKALQLPSLDQQTKTALHYELGSSLEMAGNKAAALSNFLEAYGSNIDYRDVAERIKALRP